MSQFTQFSSIALSERINAVDGIILGVCVMEKGEAKGHNLQIDDKSLDQFLQLASERKDGVKVRFGADHNAGASDINGALKNFRREGDRIRADLHLLKTDKNFSKIIEMAEMLPNEFGLSASTTAGEELIGHDRYVRFTEIFCVDIVSNPAATKGLFFSQNNNNQTNTIMLKEFALMLGLPETATEADVKTAFAAKCKMGSEDKKKTEAEADADADADAKEEKVKEIESKKKEEAEMDAECDDEGAGKVGKKAATKKFSAELDAIRLELAAIKGASQAAQASAHKVEIEGLKLEAAKEGKVIPMNDESLVKLSIPEIKDMITKLPKGQVKLSRGVVSPKNVDGKAITDKRSAEFKAYLASKREEGALALGQRILGSVNLNQN
jgi:hypothetical protein